MLSFVIVVCAVAAIAALGFAFVALFRDDAAVEDAKETARAVNRAAVRAAEASVDAQSAASTGLGGASEAQAALAGGLTDYVKALATFADSMSKLRQGVAGLLIAFALLGLAGGLAAIDDKVDDKQEQTATQPTR